jgi:hypothetical protein
MQNKYERKTARGTAVLQIAHGLRITKRAHDGYFFIDAFNCAGFVKLKHLGFIKNLAVEPVLPGVLVALWGSSVLLFCHELL